MTLPVGVTTATVTAGTPVTHTGATVSQTVTITPSVLLVHIASGIPLVDMVEELPTTNGQVSFLLPYTDQDGFQDENAQIYKNWHYTVTIQYQSAESAQSPRTKVFQLPTGTPVVDLDLLPSGTPIAPGIAVEPAWYPYVDNLAESAEAAQQAAQEAAASIVSAKESAEASANAAAVSEVAASLSATTATDAAASASASATAASGSATAAAGSATAASSSASAAAGSATTASTGATTATTKAAEAVAAANGFSIGTVNTGTPGSAAAATITGVAPDRRLNLDLPKGDTGPTGLPGDMSPVVGPANITGTVTLVEADIPSTRLRTLTGNVTFVLPTPSATRSGTITMVFTQDATGSRTITWPASVKWPDGIAQQPATAANSVSVIHLLWTGTQWLGLLGGKSFA